MAGRRVEQWKEAGRREEREKHRSEVRDLALVIAEAAAQARAEERALVRQEVLEALKPEIRIHRIPGSQMEVEVVMVSHIRAVLDIICSECPARWEGGSHRWEPGAPGSPDWCYYCEEERPAVDAGPAAPPADVERERGEG